MRLHRLEIHNYKSLRNVAIEPTPLSVFVGPNAAGKTNLADAIDFLGHVYAWGLEKAVAYKGGYDSICFRDSRRSVDPIRFRVVAEVSRVLVRALSRETERVGVPSLVDHTFAFRALSKAVQAPYSVESEHFVLSQESTPDGSFQNLRQVVRKEGRVEVQEFSDPLLVKDDMLQIGDILLNELNYVLQGEAYRSRLILSLVQRFGGETDFERLMGSLRVFQMDPASCREAGVPTPTPDLDRSGHNLPVALDNLKKKFPSEYSLVLSTARKIMPTLESIKTAWTHNRTLTLFFKERGVRSPWTSEDISTGTIQTIALLVAAFDPQTPLVVIEEPENSVHPWALRNLVEAFRLASEKKQIILTTHSPILIDQLKPEEVWVVRKPGTETKIDPLLNLDSSLKESWGQGKFTLSEYLDSGAVPQAVPAANS